LLLLIQTKQIPFVAALFFPLPLLFTPNHLVLVATAVPHHRRVLAANPPPPPTHSPSLNPRTNWTNGV
jgi:hypothetical protein